jgi:hypothetical protein
VANLGQMAEAVHLGSYSAIAASSRDLYHHNTNLNATPPSVLFGFVKRGDKAEQRVTIESRSMAQFTLRATRSDTPKVRAGAPEQREGRWLIPVSVDSSESGVVDGKLAVTTDVPGEETLEIPVYAHIIAQE